MPESVNEAGNQASFCAETVPIGPRVYFVRDGAAIKIGQSENVPRRLRSLQTGHHSTLGLLGTVPATAETEMSLHARFQHLRIKGEWFRAEAELLEFIANPVVPALVPEVETARSRFAKFHEWKNRQNFGSAAESYATTQISQWLKALINGTTPDREEGLRWALANYERVKARAA